ncbi:MAG: hypothetical protein DRR19_05885 [Candidatus Parabeggiatoa sp. nov. 1]|nr:MAG: hypothetical protein DRR19_05885 [Gammaproteobacteria bacterium]
MKQQLFQLLTEFETWQDGHPLSERRLVQHDLVLAHLARLYGGLSWDAQHFGLCPSYPLFFEIQEQMPTALSELLAVTATGKLLVCAKAEIPLCDNPSENNGLFAIAQPLPMSKALRETWPEFPLYQVQLEWRAWQAGIDDIVKTGDGIPVGRLNEDGQWDGDYIPPVMHLATDEKLSQQATEVMNRVSLLANRDNLVAELTQALRQTDLASLTPLAFWQNHCQCLVALKTHPKLADDVDYQDSVSTLLSATFSLSMIGDGLEPLRFAWKRVEQGLDKPEKRLRYVSLGWYATSMVAMVLLAVLLGMGLVSQSDKSMNELKADFENQLAALNQKQAKRLTTLDNRHVKTTQRLSEQLTALDNKQAETAFDLSKQLSALDNKQAKTTDELSKQLSFAANKQSEQLSAVDNKHVQTANKLSVRVTALDQKQAETAGDLSKQLTALGKKQTQTAQTLRTDFTALEQKQAQTINDLDKRLTLVDQKQADAIDKLDKRLTLVDNKHVQKAGELSERPIEADKRIGNVVRDRLKDGSLGPEMVVIPAGTFRMGDIQGGGDSDEKPVHPVSIKRFAMGRYEVTFAEYDKFAEATGRTKPSDSDWGRGNRPVINVSWKDATAYTVWLSQQTGKTYRLPTQAQWEYAARAGTETTYWWGNEIGSNNANCYKDFCGDNFKYTAPVGSFAPNQFGLFDTVGNVWELTCSEYEAKYNNKENKCIRQKSGSPRALRGGAWFDIPGDVRTADRNRSSHDNRGDDVGLRLARLL